MTLLESGRKRNTAGFLCGSSFRVPDDSDSKSGVIKQRQNCLESQRVEGQELPVLTLAPCVGKQDVNAVNQVRRPEKPTLSFSHHHYLVKISPQLCVCVLHLQVQHFYYINVFLWSHARANVIRRWRRNTKGRRSQLEGTECLQRKRN